jgi:hypothetical protein
LRIRLMKSLGAMPSGLAAITTTSGELSLQYLRPSSAASFQQVQAEIAEQQRNALALDNVLVDQKALNHGESSLSSRRATCS